MPRGSRPEIGLRRGESGRRGWRRTRRGERWVGVGRRSRHAHYSRLCNGKQCYIRVFVSRSRPHLLLSHHESNLQTPSSSGRRRFGTVLASFPTDCKCCCMPVSLHGQGVISAGFRNRIRPQLKRSLAPASRRWVSHHSYTSTAHATNSAFPTALHSLVSRLDAPATFAFCLALLSWSGPAGYHCHQSSDTRVLMPLGKLQHAQLGVRSCL